METATGRCRGRGREDHHLRVQAVDRGIAEPGAPLGAAVDQSLSQQVTEPPNPHHRTRPAADTRLGSSRTGVTVRSAFVREMLLLSTSNYGVETSLLMPGVSPSALEGECGQGGDAAGASQSANDRKGTRRIADGHDDYVGPRTPADPGATVARLEDAAPAAVHHGRRHSARRWSATAEAHQSSRRFAAVVHGSNR